MNGGKDMARYNLNKENRYVIYGAAFMGKDVLRGLKKAGYNVEAFLDIRAEELKSVEGIRVLHPDEYDGEEKENIVVIVAITNVFEQPQVAAYLQKKGYRKIICKLSADGIFVEESAKELFDVYEDILNGNISTNTYIEELSYKCQNIYFEDHAVVKDLGQEELVAMIPIELCHMGELEMPTNLYGQNEELEDNPNSLILQSQIKVINLFRAFEGSIYSRKKAFEEFRNYFFANPGRYYSFPRTEQGFKDIVSNRYEVYSRMGQLLNKGMDFFINTPIEVKWNPNGFFNLEDGVHRVCFFIAKGLHRIPAKMKREDYKQWKNEYVLEKCIEYMKDMNCLPSYAPIPHPNFYDYPIRRDIAGEFRFQQICCYLYEKRINVQGLKVIDLGSYFSYFSQAFSRLGASVTTVEAYESSYEAGKLLNELLYCNNIQAFKGDINDFPENENYDIVIMLTVFYPQVGTSKGEITINKVNNLTKSMLLWESGGEPEKEIQYILDHTDFVRYEKISETYGTGLVREMGAFYKK